MTGFFSPQPRPWQRYVAIGDSFSEGMSDPDPDVADRYRGWADRLAGHLAQQQPDFQYANLAIRGRLLRDITGAQLDQALAMGPDLVSMVGGGNDILRPRADIDALAAQLEAAVVRLRDQGIDVLLATPTDPAGAPILERTRSRASLYAAHIVRIAKKHDCYLLYQWSFDFLRDWRMWAQDRIHLSPEGHRRVAWGAFQALGHTPDSDDWEVPLAPEAAPGRREALRENAQWAREYAGPWVQRRLQGRSSGDLLDPKRPTWGPALPPGVGESSRGD